MKSQTTTLECPRSMVGRVIGKNGETVKALQTYTGATIQIDQTTDPTRVSISGAPYSLSLAVSMVTDIVRGSFKGFALLRQATRPVNGRGGYPAFTEPRPVYAPGYGLIPASQLYDDRNGAGFNPYAMGGPGAMPRGVGDPLQQMYPVIAQGMPQNGVLTLQQDGSLHAPPGAASLVTAQLQQLQLGSSGAAGVPQGNGVLHQHQDQGFVLQVGAAPVPVGEEYPVGAGHRLIHAAGGRGNPTSGISARPKTIFG